MDKFWDRLKPKNNAGHKNNNNPLGNLFGGPKKKSFGGQGQSLGGKNPGKVIPVTLSAAGPLGIKVERRPNAAAIVADTVEGSQAATAGIKRGDVMCFAGSDGQEEIQYEMFLEMAKSNQRPLCFELRRLNTKSAVQTSSSSADNFARRQAVIAAAEAREKAHKKKSKPIVKKEQLANRRAAAEDVVDVNQNMTNEPLSAAAAQAVAAAKSGEAQTAAALGYNPYETNKSTAGQARNATVAVAHGNMSSSAPVEGVPVAAPPSMPVASTEPLSAEFQAAYEAVVTTNHPDMVANSLGILRKLVINATTKGQEEGKDNTKFRRVRLANPKIQAAVTDVSGAVELLLSTGFTLQTENDESVVIYPANTPPIGWLPEALQLMESYASS